MNWIDSTYIELLDLHLCFGRLSFILWVASMHWLAFSLHLIILTKSSKFFLYTHILKIIRLLLSEGYEPDIIYTSRLKRAVKSTWTILNALSAPYLPVYKSWRLNERNYGALTGLNKLDAAKELGMEVVQAWYAGKKLYVCIYMYIDDGLSCWKNVVKSSCVCRKMKIAFFSFVAHSTNVQSFFSVVHINYYTRQA